MESRSGSAASCLDVFVIVAKAPLFTVSPFLMSHPVVAGRVDDTAPVAAASRSEQRLRRPPPSWRNKYKLSGCESYRCKSRMTRRDASGMRAPPRRDDDATLLRKSGSITGDDRSKSPRERPMSKQSRWNDEPASRCV